MRGIDVRFFAVTRLPPRSVAPGQVCGCPSGVHSDGSRTVRDGSGCSGIAKCDLLPLIRYRLGAVHMLPKLLVAGSNPVARSRTTPPRPPMAIGAYPLPAARSREPDPPMPTGTDKHRMSRRGLVTPTETETTISGDDGTFIMQIPWSGEEGEAYTLTASKEGSPALVVSNPLTIDGGFTAVQASS
jgi:hypothetical protein